MVLWFVASVALGADCDARALTQTLKDASPVTVAAAFEALRACDPAAAGKQAPGAVARMIDGPKTGQALVGALAVGADDAVFSWLSNAEPDVRASAVEAIGRGCETEPAAVSRMFTTAATRMTESFWNERWYRGLVGCRTPEMGAMLLDALENSPIVGRDASPHTQFYGVMTVWARNVGLAAVPKLAEWLAAARDDHEAVMIVSAFGDAARLGSGEAVDPAAADTLAAALTAAAPGLPLKALRAARDVLAAVGDSASAASLARYAWPDAIEQDAYRYGVAATEIVSCKNGKQQAILHTGTIKTPTNVWPEDVQPRFEAAVGAGWALDHGTKCKGTSTIKVESTSEPASGSARADYFKNASQAFLASVPTAAKHEVREQPEISLSSSE